MIYIKQTWDDKNPLYPTSAARLAHIEDGLEAVEESLDARISALEAGVAGVSYNTQRLFVNAVSTSFTGLDGNTDALWEFTAVGYWTGTNNNELVLQPNGGTNTSRWVEQRAWANAGVVTHDGPTGNALGMRVAQKHWGEEVKVICRALIRPAYTGTVGSWGRTALYEYSTVAITTDTMLSAHGHCRFQNSTTTNWTSLGVFFGANNFVGDLWLRRGGPL